MVGEEFRIGLQEGVRAEALERVEFRRGAGVLGASMKSAPGRPFSHLLVGKVAGQAARRTQAQHRRHSP